MTIIVGVLIATFAAFAVWLSVRMVNRRERWTTRTSHVLFMVVLSYPASVGPVCWWMALPVGPEDPPRIPVIYWPLGRVAANGPDLIYPPVRWWMGFGVRRGRNVWIPTNSSNTEWIGMRK